MKRGFDIIASAVGLILLAPVFGIAVLAIRLTSGSPVIFRQKRMGRGFRPFTIYKFRTMVVDAPLKGGSITSHRDSRITPIGAIMRKFKVDELPQLVNVLKGDMSLVGPRPEMPEFVRQFEQDYRVILRIRPGITDLASLKYHNESEVLAKYENPSEAYVRCILPDKLSLSKEYVNRSSFLFDIELILRTLLKLTHAGWRIGTVG
jgi:lipopolysaccharide/colanic/teichoic acid biosynthesis glycosyltransferase